MNNAVNNKLDVSNYPLYNLITIENSDNTFHKLIPIQLAYLSPTIVNILNHKHFKENKERRIIFHSISASVLEEVIRYLHYEYSMQNKSPKANVDYNVPVNLSYDLLCFGDYLELNGLIDKAAQTFATNFENVMTFELLPEYIIDRIFSYLSIPNLVRAEKVIKKERIRIDIDQYWNKLYHKQTDRRGILIQNYLEDSISNSICNNNNSKCNETIIINLIELLLPEIEEIHIHNPNLSNNIISTFCNNMNRLKLLDLSNNNINFQVFEVWCKYLKKHEVYVNRLNLSSTNMKEEDVKVLFSNIKSSYFPPIPNIKTSPINCERKSINNNNRFYNNNNYNNSIYYSPHSPLSKPKPKIKSAINDIKKKRIITTITTANKTKISVKCDKKSVISNCHYIKLDIHNNPLNNNISKTSLLLKSIINKKFDLIELNISNNVNIGSECSIVIGELLKYTETLEYLNISNMNLGCKGINNVFDGLRYNFSLKSLDISSNITSPQCLLEEPMNYLSIESSLKTNTSLKELSLSNNICSNLLIDSLIKGLEINTSIKVLRLSNCRLNNINFNELILSLFHHSNLTSLDISNNLISSNNMCEFIQIINKCEIKCLDISNNSMNSRFISKLSNELNNNTILTSLNLSGNVNNDKSKIELIGSYSFNEIEISNNYLQKLYLNNQNIRDTGCINLSKWLINSRINELYLRNNGITSRGLMFIIDTVSVLYNKLIVENNDNELIIYIDLSDNCLDETGFMTIRDIYKLYGEKVKIRVN